MSIIDYKPVVIADKNCIEIRCASVHRDTSVFPPQVFLGNGQGCGTIWFDNAAEAREAFKNIGAIPTGHMAGVCEQCANWYSHDAPQQKDGTVKGVMECRVFKNIVSNTLHLPEVE